MLNTLTSLRTLLFGLFLIMLGSGLQGTLLSLRATLEGFSAFLTGLIMSGYYIGYLVGSVWIPRMTHEVGHIRVFGAMAAIASGTILLHIVFVDPWAWLVFRVVTGFCFVGIFITVESWVNQFTRNELRGKILAVYMVIQLMGSGLGQLLLNIEDPKGIMLFVLVSVVISMASVPMLLSTRARAPEINQPPRLDWSNTFTLAPLGLVGALAVGITSGAFWGVGPVYASKLGLSVASIGMFMAVVILGGVLLQWPLGWLADRVPRKRVIAGVALAAAFVSLALLILGAGPSFFFLALLFGGLSLPLYSILCAYTIDHVSVDEMVAASSTLILVYGVGAILGPIVGGVMISALGSAGFYTLQTMVFVLLGSYAFRLEKVAPEELPEEPAPTVPLPMRPTPLAAVAAAETMAEAVEEAKEERGGEEAVSAMQSEGDDDFGSQSPPLPSPGSQ